MCGTRCNASFSHACVSSPRRYSHSSSAVSPPRTRRMPRALPLHCSRGTRVILPQSCARLSAARDTWCRCGTQCNADSACACARAPRRQRQNRCVTSTSHTPRRRRRRRIYDKSAKWRQSLGCLSAVFCMTRMCGTRHNGLCDPVFLHFLYGASRNVLCFSSSYR